MDCVHFCTLDNCKTTKAHITKTEIGKVNLKLLERNERMGDEYDLVVIDEAPYSARKLSFQGISAVLRRCKITLYYLILPKTHHNDTVKKKLKV